MFQYEKDSLLQLADTIIEAFGNQVVSMYASG